MKEIFDEHFCLLNKCDRQPMPDGTLPCAECPNLVDVATLTESENAEM